jgi:formylglycine-generating enzyme required for sulfatase activity
LGIHDLAGNVSEWIHDFYSIALPSGVLTDPTGPDRGEYHVVRGSNYTHGRFSELRWTFRDYGADARADVGFRIARYLE